MTTLFYKGFILQGEIDAGHKKSAIPVALKTSFCGDAGVSVFLGVWPRLSSRSFSP